MRSFPAEQNDSANLFCIVTNFRILSKDILDLNFCSSVYQKLNKKADASLLGVCFRTIMVFFWERTEINIRPFYKVQCLQRLLGRCDKLHHYFSHFQLLSKPLMKYFNIIELKKKLSSVSPTYTSIRMELLHHYQVSFSVVKYIVTTIDRHCPNHYTII